MTQSSPPEPWMQDSLREGYAAREWLDSREAGCPDASPIFIVGQPRTFRLRFSCGL